MALSARVLAVTLDIDAFPPAYFLKIDIMLAFASSPLVFAYLTAFIFSATCLVIAHAMTCSVLKATRAFFLASSSPFPLP
jgi:hypothetical protein